jgi:hypothetical protein
MTRLRRALFAFLMAFAVVLGQQAVAMHDLAHATGHKESAPGKTTCDKCFACAELSSAVGASVPAVALPDATPQAFHPEHDAAVCLPARVAYFSRAPPAFL